MGTRLGSTLPKALVPLAGTPLIVRAIAGLQAAGVCQRIVVCFPPEHRDAFAAALTGVFPVPALDVVMVPGGLTRQASVNRGLAAVESASFVLVHDAARALTPPSVIRRVHAALVSGHDAVIPVLPVVDTLKREVAPWSDDEVGVVAQTESRAGLWRVQTPQGFAVELLRTAHRYGEQRAHSPDLAATDDAGLVEQLGKPVHMVAGDERALKITTRTDLLVATAMMDE